MLILSRKANESIMIDGAIEVKVMRLDGDQIRLGIDAPADVPVHRMEIYREILKNNRAALTRGRPTVPLLSPEEFKDETPTMRTKKCLATEKEHSNTTITVNQ